ncbi:MAG: phosphatase PAP2 family protein [Polaromonas sp.]|uniref:phosphatase PAP2 family protein n=1 Tax=Polaromonas sp. TaxID=1869339 RepID=UPI003266EDD1
MKPTPSRQSPWPQIGRVIFQHFYLKGIGTMAFIAVFFGAYFYLLKHPAFPIVVMPLTWPDRLIGFEPLALPVYLSLWVYVSLPPLFFSDRSELLRYGGAIALTCLAGLLVFYFWPTATPPADIDWVKYPEMLFLKNMDTAGNACPSLHVATAVFSGIWLHYLLIRFTVPSWLLTVNAIWCFGIAYSTLATRQHVAVDVFAGILLGGLAAWLSLFLHQRRIAGR